MTYRLILILRCGWTSRVAETFEKDIDYFFLGDVYHSHVFGVSIRVVVWDAPFDKLRVYLPE